MSTFAHVMPYVATAITAFIVGIWLTAVIALAAINRSQERMQKKVRHWQDEAVRRGYGRSSNDEPLP